MSGSNKARIYRLINADGHVNEPPDLWTSRLPSSVRSRAPRQESFSEGDAWVLEGVEDPINFGMNACAGMDPEDMKAWMPWSKLRRGGWDPAARLVEQDADSVDAEILYPTPRLSQGLTSNPDRSFQVALVKAYNDWLSEYCAHAPDRLFGMALIPSCGVAEAVEEFERAMQLPGIAGPVINCYPHGDTQLRPEDDPLWRSICEIGVPLGIHASLTDKMPTAHTTKLPGDVRFHDPCQRMLQFIWGGTLDRFPELKIVFGEVDVGWVPYFKEQVQDRYQRMSKAGRFGISKQPSEYFDNNFHFTYVTDSYGIANRHAVGVDKIMWSSDYPHIGADWPTSSRTIAASFATVPAAERDAILAGNALRLYRIS
jgi:predicted TIM-barrel fold metal-dependent hydrolase